MTTLQFYRYATNVVSYPIVADESEIWFTVKKLKSQLDSESMLQISKTGGLLYINGLTPILAGLTSADASIAVVAGNLVITLNAGASALINEYGGLVGEIKTKSTLGVVIIAYQFNVTTISAITHSI
jgi:hypothetical protein